MATPRPGSTLPPPQPLLPVTDGNTSESETKNPDLKSPASNSVSQIEWTMLALGYSVTSSSLSLINKWVLNKWPYSGTLTMIQFGTAAAVVYLIKILNMAEVDDITSSKATAFATANN